MRISEVVTTPLWLPYTQPYHWAQGVNLGACVVLVEVHTDEGATGYGESIASPSADAVRSYLSRAAEICAGRSPFENARLMGEIYHALFQASGTCSAPRFAAQVLAGLEMALWDIAGKVTGRPVHELLGGAVHDSISYFGFPQGALASEIARSAGQMAGSGIEVIYVKLGRGSELDLEIVREVREAIGPQARLRVDPNERWNPVSGARMSRKLLEFDVEVIEQPVDAESVGALAQLRSNSPIAIAADQSVFTPHDAFDIVRERAADMIVIGLHETGGLLRFCKVAHIAEAAGINVCIHGLHESGITTVASHHAAATAPNLDDGNQYMNQLLDWDIIRKPDLTLEGGKLPLLPGPGLGFELDLDAVGRASEAYKERS